MRKTITFATIILCACLVLASCSDIYDENSATTEAEATLDVPTSEAETIFADTNASSTETTDASIEADEVTTQAEDVSVLDDTTQTPTEETALPVVPVEHSFGSWTTLLGATCVYDGVCCRVCETCGFEEVGLIPALGHDVIIHDENLPTCTEPGWDMYVTCSRCHYTNFETLSALGHTFVTVGAIKPSETEFGASGEVYCLMCGLVEKMSIPLLPTGFSNPENYISLSEYIQLTELESCESLQDFYRLVDEFATEFHINTAINITDNLLMTELNYAQFGLTADEALTALEAYIADRPLYYWLDGEVQITDVSLRLYISPDYANGEARALKNADIYETVQSCLSSINWSYSYDMALAIHNALSKLDKPILGSYTQTIRLLLNYCDIPANIFIEN